MSEDARRGPSKVTIGLAVGVLVLALLALLDTVLTMAAAVADPPTCTEDCGLLSLSIATLVLMLWWAGAAAVTVLAIRDMVRGPGPRRIAGTVCLVITVLPFLVLALLSASRGVFTA